MGDYFRAVATPVEKQDCMAVLRNAWIAQFGAPPKDDAVRLMTAQWGLETSWGKNGYCYNLGNIRASQDSDFTYIGGNEIIDGEVVWFSGQQPSALSKFRAFRTLVSAAEYYVAFMGRRAPVMAVLQGSCDPTEFVKALEEVDYFTDDLDHYTRVFCSVYQQVAPLPVPASGAVTGYPDLEPDPGGDPALTPAAPAPPAPTPTVPAQAAPAPAPPPAPAAPRRVELARFTVRARRVGATEATARLRIGATSAAVAAVATEPSSSPVAQPVAVAAAAPSAVVEAAPVSTVAPAGTTQAAERRGAREIFAGLPQVLGQDGPEAREAALWAEIEAGNFPGFVRSFAPVVVTDARGRRATFQVTVDCFAIGTDDDWLRVPLSGYYAQKTADRFGAFLPTNRLVLETYAQAAIKLVAHPLDCQTTYQGKWQRSTFAKQLHDEIVQGQVPCKPGGKVPEAAGRLDPKLGAHPDTCALPPGAHPGVLVSGHLKEVIISHEDLTKRLAFWGFFAADGRPIQRGFGCPHGPGFADYSHGFRLVGPTVDVDGRSVPYDEMVQSPDYAPLCFAEGGQPCKPPRYPAPPDRFYMGR